MTPQSPVPSDQSSSPEQNSFAPTPPQPAYEQPPLMAQPSAPGVGAPYQVAAENPGKTLGIVSIVLGALMIWIVGLPLGIVSIVKSRKAQASPMLGIIGTILNALAIIGSIILVMLVVMAYGGLKESAKEVQQEATSNQAKLDAETQSAVGGLDVPITESYKVTKGDGNAYWSFPAPPSGWKLVTFDKEGVNTIQRTDDSAQFTSYQGIESITGTDEEATRTGINTYLTALSAKKVGAESTMIFSRMSDGKSVEFITQNYTFLAPDSVPAKGRIAGRVFDNGHVLLVAYYAVEDTFSETDWDSLTAKLHIDDGVM